MTLTEIQEHFGDAMVYKYNGELPQLQQLAAEQGWSINYLIVRWIPYFVVQTDIDAAIDSNISLMQG